MPSIKKSYIGSTLGSTNTPLDEVEVTPPDVPTPRAHYDETSITYGTGTVSGRWDNIGWETDTIWHISDANNVNDPGQALINGINAVVTESSRIRTPMNTTTIAQEWNVFFVIEPSADVTTGQGIADARSLRTGALQLYILNDEMIFAVEDGPGDLRLEARPEAQVVWMRCMGQAGDSTFQITTAVDVRSVSGPLNDVVHAWIRIFNGLGSPVGQAHYPGKIGEIVLHETLTVDQGQAVVNSLANKWLNEVPLWSDVPDATVSAGIEYNINMNLWVDGRGELLFNWVLNGGVTGVTIDQNGVITVETNVLPQTLSLSVTVENTHGASTSNTFDWVLDEDTSPPAPIWIEQPEDQLTNENDLPGTYDVSELVSSFVPLTWAVTAPATIDTNGVISINTAVGVYPLTVTATNETGSTDSDEFNWTIEEGGTPPEWDEVPDNWIHVDDLPTTVDMNQWVTGDNLTGWQLSGAPTGVTIDANGIVSIDAIPAQNAIMTCYVANNAGSATSNPFRWAIADSPIITTQPSPIEIEMPEGGELTVVATHDDPDAPIYYRWEGYRGGENPWTWLNNVMSDVIRAGSATVEILSTNQDDLELSPIRARVRVWAYEEESSFETISDEVLITITDTDLVWTQHPQDSAVQEGEGTSFTAETNETEGVTYRWEALAPGEVDWLPVTEVLSDVQEGSQFTNELILDSTSLGEPDVDPPVWEPVSNITIFDDQEAGYSRDVSIFVLGEVDSWNTNAGTIDSDGVFTPPTTGLGTYTYQQTATNTGGSAQSNEWTLTIQERVAPGDGYDPSNMTYVGAFVGTSEGPNSDDQNMGDYRNIALNNSRDGLFVHGKNGTGRSQAICMVDIPTPAPEGTARASLPTTSVVQPWRRLWDPTNLELENPEPSSDGNPNLIGSMLHLPDGRLLVQSILHYPSSTDPQASCVLLEDGDDINAGDVRGFFLLERGRRFANHYIEVPVQYQPDFGGLRYAVGGSSNVASRNETTSAGPSFGVFNEDQITSSAADAGDWTYVNEPSVVYPWQSAGEVLPWGYSQQLVNGPTITPENNRDFFNALGNPNIWTQKNRAIGGVIVPNTNTYMVFGPAAGFEGTRIVYKSTYWNSWDYSDHPNASNPGQGGPETIAEWTIGSEYLPNSGGSNDLCRDWDDCRDPEDSQWRLTGGHELVADDDQSNAYWLYNVQDLIDARNGLMNPEDVQPYDWGMLDLPYQWHEEHDDLFCELGGLAYDAEADLLYLTLDNAQSNRNTTRAPIYLVYKLNPPESNT